MLPALAPLAHGACARDAAVLRRRDLRSRTLTQVRHSVGDERVLAALARVPREVFVGADHRAGAWRNRPQPIGCGQTISQPLVVARMLALLELRGGERVLDIGTGSGWHAALLAELAAEVWSIERHAELSAQAAASLDAAGVTRVRLVVGDGAHGLPTLAPFDAINVAAAAAGTGALRALEGQLGPGGRLVAPVEDPEGEQHLMLVRRGPAGIVRLQLDRVRFVPLVVE